MPETIRERRLRHQAEHARPPRLPKPQKPLREGETRRENVIPLEQIEALVGRVLGYVVPDKIVDWLGVNTRTAERWLVGDSTFPPTVVATLQDLEPKIDEMLFEFEEVIEHYIAQGLPENLIRMRLRDLTRTLSSEPPPRPMRPYTSESAPEDGEEIAPSFGM